MVGPGRLVTNSRWVEVCVVLRSSIEMRPHALWGLATPGPVIRTASPAEWATRQGQLGFTLSPGDPRVYWYLVLALQRRCVGAFET